MYRKVLCVILSLTFLLSGVTPAEAKAEVSAADYSNAVQTMSASGTKNVFAKSKVQPMVSGGFNYSVILKDDGTVWSCGGNEVGNLGNGKYDLICKPAQVLGLTDVIAIDCADAFTLALKSDGTVWGWGFNMYNGLGIGKPITCSYASPICGVKDVAAIAAGNTTSIFVKKDGTVWYTTQINNMPSKLTQLKGLKDIVSVASCHMNAIFLTKDGEVWTWDWEDDSKVKKPEKQKLKDIKSVSAGDFHYMALEKDGDLWTWGMNNSGEIGDGTHEWCYSPKKVAGLKNVKLISGGGYYSVALLEDGTFYAWGDNECGQFGNNSIKSSTKPVEAKGFKDVISVDAGMYHTIAIKSNGEVIIAGNNYDGVLGVKDKKEHSTPVVLMDLTKITPVTDDKNIYINGDLTDWGEVTAIAKGAAPKGKKMIGIKELYARKAEDGCLYLAASITEGLPAFVNFNLDTNNDNKAEYKVCFKDEQYSTVTLYKINGKSLKKLKDLYAGVYGNVIETSIFNDAIGNPERVNITVTYGADKKKNKINTEITQWTAAPGSRIAVEDRSIKMGAITIDGKLDDWEKLDKTVIEDPKGDSECWADVTTIYAAMDSEYLYVSAYVTGKPYPSIGTKLDCNNDGKDDYGANASAKDGNVYYFYFPPNKEATDNGRSENIAFNGRILEFAVPLSTIGNPKSCSIHVWADNNDGKGFDNVDGYYEVAVNNE